MWKIALRVARFLMPAISLSLLLACGGPQQPTISQADAVARSARDCGASRLQTGLDMDNFVTTDLGSRLAVRSAANSSAQVIGYLSYQNSVSVKSIDTGSREYVEIYPPAGLKCSAAACGGRRLFVSHRFLEPVSYTPICRSAKASADSIDVQAIRSSIDPSIDPNESSSYQQNLRDFSNGQPVKGMIRYADANREPASTGMCLRYVKKAMLTGGKFFASYPGEIAARKFGPHLENANFENILELQDYRQKIELSMANIPVGCIAVYSYININGDKNAKYGHIEIRTPSGFESDYFSSLPRTGSWTATAARNRKLIGVYCKVR